MKTLWFLIPAFALCMGLTLAEYTENSIPDTGKTLPVKSFPLKGSWLLLERNREELPVGMNVVMLVTDTYAAWTAYDRVSRKFYYTGGGPYQADKARFEMTLEFNTQDSTQVGSRLAYDYVLKGKRLALNTLAGEEIWERIDASAPASTLAGVWRITGREQEGKMVAMPAGARKTIKILSGTRFQWAAINPETRQLFGTGGGTYSLTNGKYTETIEFFPRDPQRVGMSLTFDAAVNGKRWEHQGKSTAGTPVHEVWEKQE